MFMLMSSAANARSLEKGMKGEDVKQWQLFLIQKGFMSPPALGNFSDRTLKATITFQNGKHFPSASTS
jgi:peptidoglycan hydrolase-like protein with peptidoglycan-binding domain